MSGGLIRLISRSKLVERSLFAIIDLLQGAKFFLLYLYGVWGDEFIKKSSLDFFFSFCFLSNLVFFMLLYYYSLIFKWQSEHAGRRPDTSSLVPTFDTKVTKYLCSGWVFFLQTNFDFLISHFWRIFFTSFERYWCVELKFKKIFWLWSFFVKLWGFKDWRFGQFGTINARYILRY